jgi:hypothetical protein
VLDEVAGVRHAVALDVGAVRVLRVGPPVIAFREKIVHATGTSWGSGCCDRDWFFFQILIRGLENPRSIESGDIEGRALGRNG